MLLQMRSNLTAVLKNQRLREMCELLPQWFTETSVGAGEAHGIQLHFLEAIHKVFLVDVVTVDNLGPLVPVATLRAILDSEGAPHGLASGGIQHGLLAGNADFELHGLHLGPVELSNGLICRLHLFIGDEGTVSGRVHGEVNDVSKGREGPTEEGGCHVFSIHIESVPLARGPAFRE